MLQLFRQIFKLVTFYDVFGAAQVEVVGLLSFFQASVAPIGAFVFCLIWLGTP